MRPTFFCCFSHAGSSNPSRSHSSSSSIYPSYSCSDIFLVLRGMKSLSKWQNCCYPVGKLSLLVFLHGASVPPRQRSQSRDHFRRFIRFASRELSELLLCVNKPRWGGSNIADKASYYNQLIQIMHYNFITFLLRILNIK